MLKWIEATGKNEDAAIQNALEQLGLDRDSVSVEVLERAKSGFFGLGGNPAKVKVTYEAPDEQPPAPAPGRPGAPGRRPAPRPPRPPTGGPPPSAASRSKRPSTRPPPNHPTRKPPRHPTPLRKLPQRPPNPPLPSRTPRWRGQSWNSGSRASFWACWNTWASAPR